MKKRALSLLLALTLCVLIPQPARAAEQPSPWAAEQVARAVSLGLVPGALRAGYTQAATRAEFCALAVALYETVQGKQITALARFSDTNDKNVQKMGGLGVVGGVGGDRFAPGDTLNREQAATMLSRLFDALGLPLADGAADFADQAALSPWAVAAVGQVQAAGIMQGAGLRFLPQGEYTREQCMVSMLRAYELVIQRRLPDGAYPLAAEPLVASDAVGWQFPRWSAAPKTYLTANADGSLSAVTVGGSVRIETYDAARQLSATVTLAPELPIFGGYYRGKNYHYIAFGQVNAEEDDAREVIRVVKYNRDFKRVGSVSVTGGTSFTTIPFDAAAGRMCEYGDTLVFHTARQRYAASDGVRNQSQLTLVIDTAAMRVTNDLSAFQENYVGHSFDQYVLFDGGAHVLLDHGDAYPRSVVLNKSSGARYDRVDLFPIPGDIGANATGVSVGGFEMSSSHYLTAINSVDHSLVTGYTSYDLIGPKPERRDIILCTVPKKELNNAAVSQVMLQSYTNTEQIGSIPKLVKIADNSFMVLWQEFTPAEGGFRRGDVKYRMVDGAGNPAGETVSLPGFVLSACKPIVTGDAVVWITHADGGRVLYTIPLR